MAIFDELKRRKVFRVTSVYAVTAWGASLGAAELFPTFGLPEQSVRWFVIAALCFLPVVALLAWLYELTPDGISRDPADLPQAEPQKANPSNNGRNSTKQDLDSTHRAPHKVSADLEAIWTGGSKIFSDSFTMGREPSCELHIDDPKISRRHARVIAQHGSWYIEDLGSANGTILNGKLVTRAILPAKSRITLYEGAADITLNIKSSGTTTTVFAGQTSNSSIKKTEEGSKNGN